MINWCCVINNSCNWKQLGRPICCISSRKIFFLFDLLTITPNLNFAFIFSLLSVKFRQTEHSFSKNSWIGVNLVEVYFVLSQGFVTAFFSSNQLPLTFSNTTFLKKISENLIKCFSRYCPLWSIAKYIC